MASDSNITNLDQMAVPSSPLGRLSFTAERPDGTIDAWAPAPIAGGWDDQCFAGRNLAGEAISFIQQDANPVLLSSIVRAISERGVFGGVEAGFFTALSEHLLH